uniref:Protein deacetylase HDAC6 n=1 Tax=Esox lucius TaxID=8010 RepID=A0A6Q2ZG01_ESOLU
MDSVPAASEPRTQSRVSPDNNTKTNNLQETRRRGRMDRSKGQEDIANHMMNLDLGHKGPATGTGLVFSDIFSRYHCLWDPSHPECPQRVTSVMDMVEQQGLQSRCVLVEAQPATEEQLLLVHTKEYVDLMRSTQQMNEDQLKALSDTYNSVYIHPSYTCACYAVGSVLQLVDKLMTSDLRNGFSVARPPGHHAHSEKMNGYCMFNNLAIAARYAQTHHQVARVLVVDWDVHHGQGIQYIFQEDPSVLYFSVHRYEEGLFWPHLAESDSNSVGSGPGEGYNINLPWNQVGMTDADYITAFQQLLLPVAYEFQPQLVLVAAGFDCMTGDPKGEMSATAQGLSVLTHMLMGLAQGKVLLALEGGYNLQSTAEGVCACLRTLLGESCPRLRSPSGPSDGALRSISRSISALYPYWTSLQVLEGGPLSCIDTLKKMKDTSTLTTAEEMKDTSTLTTGLVYDQRMMEHHNMWDSHHPELPQRIQRIFSLHESLGLVSRCLMLPARLATEEELALCHSSKHIAQIKATEVMKPRDLHRLGNEYNSIFISAESYRSARLAVGACFNMAQAVLNGRVRNGAAVVRPPGHHAEKDAACGFCFFNSAALTARYAQSISQKPLRVLILDWDVHHGNGTQHIFEEDDSVLYVSLHRYEDGTFFPSSEDADYSRVGLGRGAGFNVNIPWNGAKMGDAEYLAAFHSVVMPVAREFDPGLVLVSAGFDAARGDPLGGYQVTPEGYANLTHLLLGLAGGRVLVILEGGYNLTSISESMSACTSVLLGDPPPPLPCRSPPHPNAAVSINNVIRTHAPYWRSLRIQLPESLRLSLPSPKHRGKRTSKGKGKKSPRQGDGGGASPGQTTRLSTGGQGNCDLDDLTKGLVSLDLNQTASPNPSPASVAVGGARQKLRPGPLESPVKGLNKEATTVGNTPEILHPTPDRPKTVDQENGSPETEFQGGTLYVVDPLSWCPHLDAVKPVPAGGMDVFLPCEDCGSDAENWICLTCYKVFCGRYVNQHMVTHGLVSEHPVVLSFADLSVWCYSCEAYVHNQAVFEAKDTAHRVKFGEDMPFST